MALVTAEKGLQPDVNQIYPIVNSIFKQMTGREDITAVDTASLVAMGQEVENLGKTELWLNTLARRIGYTIDSYRVYKNKFADLYRTQVEWGAMVQKLTAEMPEATLDKMFDVGKMDGQSVDHYIINNPKVHQRIFDKETPYSFYITTQTKLLKRSFLGEAAMQALITQIFGKVNNKIEFVLEELARMAVANFVLNLKTVQEFHLITMFNTLRGANLTGETARFNPEFLRFAVGQMNAVSKKMENMSVLYNSDRFDRFTPRDQQRLYILADFITMCDTVTMYDAHNPEYITAHPHNEVPYWQASGTTINQNSWRSITGIKGSVKGEKGSVETSKNNLIALLFDREAIGTFREENEVLTTPVNARAAYYNTFWHENQLWFNDMSENGVAFYFD